VRLEAYSSRDIYDLLDEVPQDGVIIAFLPTYAGGYERMFKRLEEILDWDRPDYGLIDEDRKKRILTRMTERDYLYLDDRKWQGLPLVAWVRKAMMKPVYIYANMAALRLGVLKQQRHAEFVPFARLSDGDEIRSFLALRIRGQSPVLFATPAPSLSSLIKSTYHIDNVECTFLPNIVEARAGEIEKHPKPRVIFLGRLDPIKRPWLFVQIARRFPDVEFYMLGQSHFHGPGSWLPAGLPRNLTLIGHLNGKKNSN